MFDGRPKQIIIYETAAGAQPLEEWMTKLRDTETIARLAGRIDRLEQGNPGDYKAVGAGVYELRIDYGPGFLSILLSQSSNSSCCFAVATNLRKCATFSARGSIGKIINKGTKKAQIMMRWEDFLKNRLAASPDEAAAYLRVTLAENGHAAFALALRRVIEARGGLADLPLSAAELAAMLEALDANVSQAA